MRFLAGIAAIALASCARSSAPPLLPAGAVASPRVSDAGPSTKYRVIFNFGESAHGYDGSGPEAALLDVDGTFYGTTLGGGAAGAQNGAGTVFSVTPAGKERVLHSFGTGYDGAYPQAGLVALGDALYGTTLQGGDYGEGTIFKVTLNGHESVLHSFGSYGDGASPYAGLIVVGGALYGTTAVGGKQHVGTVYSITPDGQEHVLHDFTNGKDGAYPEAALLNVKGVLYSTTSFGGLGGGTVFKVTPAGDESVIYSFDQASAGDHPESVLTKIGARFYSTTESGGTGGWGTVFSVGIDGKNERVLHSFTADGSDGLRPLSGLIAAGGTLYGTTFTGGVANFGTVYSVDERTGAEHVLHAFSSGGRKNDGMWLQGGLIFVKGMLYGTTELGGFSSPSCAYSGGCDWGTVFALQP